MNLVLMKRYVLLLVAGAPFVFAQQAEKESQIPKPLQEACKAASDRAIEASKESDTLDYFVTCAYGEKEKLRKPRRYYPLTKLESTHLDRLRETSNTAYEALDHYENEVMARHGHPKIPTSDPCWHFVGIVVNEHVITEDPNFLMPGCEK